MRDWHLVDVHKVCHEESVVAFSPSSHVSFNAVETRNACSVLRL